MAAIASTITEIVFVTQYFQNLVQEVDTTTAKLLVDIYQALSLLTR